MTKRLAPTVALLALSACINTAHYVVDKHGFTIPAPYVDAAPFYAFWRDKPTSLSFTLNPADPPEKQHTVNVESPTDTCGPNRLAGASPLGAACAAARAHSHTTISPHLSRTGNARQWAYQSGGRTVATCYLPPKGQGLCTAVSNYQDLLISIGFHAEEAHDLPAMEAEARRLLKGWDEAK